MHMVSLKDLFIVFFDKLFIVLYIIYVTICCKRIVNIYTNKTRIDMSNLLVYFIGKSIDIRKHIYIIYIYKGIYIITD